MNEFVKKELIDNSIDLSHLGIKELVWSYDSVLEILNDLLKNKIVIYGGDILQNKGDKVL